MRSVLQLGALPLAAITAVALASTFGGCTITTNDAPLSDAGDTGTVTDDTGTPVDDTGVVTDTGTPETSGPAVIIKALSLIGSTTTDDIRDFGGGSTRSDIVDGGRIAYGFAKVGTQESSVIGKDSAGAYVDGRLEGLTPGTPVTITVTGYLRGLNGNDDADPMFRIPWATTTCTATPSATVDVVAECTKLSLIPDLKGIVISSDVLPPSWCTSKGMTKLTDGTDKTVFDRLRARTPYDGTAAVSKTVNDCLGVIWIPFSEYSAAEDAAGVSNWSLSLETNDSGTACTLASPGCVVDRKVGTADETDIYVVGEACRLNNDTAPRTPACF